jgi:hypothetical protein
VLPATAEPTRAPAGVVALPSAGSGRASGGALVPSLMAMMGVTIAAVAGAAQMGRRR